jgi:hypothetical protein
MSQLPCEPQESLEMGGEQGFVNEARKVYSILGKEECVEVRGQESGIETHS